MSGTHGHRATGRVGLARFANGLPLVVHCVAKSRSRRPQNQPPSAASDPTDSARGTPSSHGHLPHTEQARHLEFASADAVRMSQVP